jgi:hypothetical protein
MRRLMMLLTVVLVLSPFTGHAQDRAALDAAAKALGATDLKSIEIQASGLFFWAGQRQTPGMAWPQFNVRSLKRTVNYETASLRDDMTRARTLEPPKGGGPYVRGEHTAVAVVSGDHAWNVVGDNAVAAPIALGERQLQLWSTPHGVIKAAQKNPAGPGADDRVRSARPVQGDGVSRRRQSRRAGRGDAVEPRAGRHAGDGHLQRLP